MMKSYQITEWCHEIIKSQVQREGIYIDATMGNGYDTAFFCELAGEKGKVYAFDIQELAAERTGKLLEQRGLTARAQLILDSHKTGYQRKSHTHRTGHTKGGRIDEPLHI